MKELNRSYKMSDPSLVLKCEDVLDSIDRDITEFNARGFTALKRTAFEDAITNFDGLPSDNYLKGLQQIKTGEKNTTRALCETAVNVVLTAVVNVWGLHSTHYDFFTEDKSLSQLSDTELLRYLEDVADATDDSLTDLAGEGITAATVTALRDLRTDFNNALKAQRIAIKNRNTGEGLRVKTGNALYKLLVGYCNTGKNIWIDIDETKYNDYVINDTPDAAGDSAGYDIAEFIVPANSSVQIELDVPVVPNLDLYLLAVDGDIMVCTTNMPAVPCIVGSSYLLQEDVLFKDKLSALNLDLSKTHFQFTNNNADNVVLKVGRKNNP